MDCLRHDDHAQRLPKVRPRERAAQLGRVHWEAGAQHLGHEEYVSTSNSAQTAVVGLYGTPKPIR